MPILTPEPELAIFEVSEPSIFEAAIEPSIFEAAIEPSIFEAAIEPSIFEAAIEPVLDVLGISENEVNSLD
ncbi:MAG: hypothetical protein FJX80_15665 [Bacteroidetes bacterium]|nr:hypothetical protein [Bacteroidota bacterium]